MLFVITHDLTCFVAKRNHVNVACSAFVPVHKSPVPIARRAEPLQNLAYRFSRALGVTVKYAFSDERPSAASGITCYGSRIHVHDRVAKVAYTTGEVSSSTTQRQYSDISIKASVAARRRLDFAETGECFQCGQAAFRVISDRAAQCQTVLARARDRQTKGR